MEEGFFYHIYNRGVNKENLFYEDRNYEYFLNKFDKYLFKYLDIYAYCLMPNHFHFIVRVKETTEYKSIINNNNLYPGGTQLTSLQKAFRDFFICYAKSINKVQGRTGALFQYKFKRKLINKEIYLARLVAYIHLNPVRAGLCSIPEEWVFSSYNSFISIKKTKIKRDEALEWFGKKEYFIEFHRTYREYQKERDYLFKE